jgi:SRSO17 transposase
MPAISGGASIMVKLTQFDEYMTHLCEGLGYATRHRSLIDYCSGLMLPIARKSVEPLAAHADPRHVRAKHQALHHFVANAPWSDRVLLDRVRSYVQPHLGLHRGTFWIVDDTGHPKCGTHSVGVARQYCGQLGKIDNCQVAVSLSLATDEASVPVDYQLYLSQEWAKDSERRRAASVPDSVRFATKPQIALAQIRAAQQRGVPPGIVLADAAYGTNTVFREGVQALGLSYAVSVISSTSVWAPGSAPLPPAPHRGRGRAPTRVRRAPGHQPASVKAIAFGLEPAVWRTVAWREGTNQTLRSRFARVRVRAAHLHNRRPCADDEQWLLIEWPKGQAEPTRYWLSTLPPDISPKDLVNCAKMRWRIEHDYHELKQEFGLSHYEGRGWPGFHHHAALCVAAYGFLTAQRLKQGFKKNAARLQTLALPEGYQPRGRRPNPAPRPRLHPDASLSRRHGARAASAPLPLL